MIKKSVCVSVYITRGNIISKVTSVFLSIYKYMMFYLHLVTNFLDKLCILFGYVITVTLAGRDPKQVYRLHIAYVDISSRQRTSG